MMGLRRYRAKRDFTVTPEPKGGRRSESGVSYVIQKHAASHLHYDFRLELDGVLLSWAVPKGPSLDPQVKRLAMQTEDHPIEYGSFEGTIPKGEYGGGTVMVWDQGTWEPLEDPRKSYAKGHLRFALHGAKLRGTWHLVRASKRDEKKQGWLLFKSHDDEARTDSSIIDDQPNSAETGRSMEQIAEAADNVWHSNRTSREAKAEKPHRPNVRSRQLRTNEAIEALLEQGEKGPIPRGLQPQRATLVKKAPIGEGWAHELEYNGYRMLARVDDGAVTLLNRNGRIPINKPPFPVTVIANLPCATALLDGELAVLRPNGTVDVSGLQQALKTGKDGITFFVFDILYLNGRDLRSLPLSDRKTLLEAVMASNDDRRLQINRHLVSSGAKFFKAACELHAEGIVSKRLDRPYRSGKGRDWLKTKCVGRREKLPTVELEQSEESATNRRKMVPLTHPARVLYPAEGITKQELADYYAAVSPWMLPHVANRPLTLVRCPQGLGGQTFFQKHAKPPLPKAIRAIPINDDGALTKYMAIDDEAGLVSLAQMSVLEIHTWGAHADDPEKPDFLVFDLDPDLEVTWEAVIECARLVRTGLTQLGLKSYVKTTGGKGLHVCTPIDRRVSWDEAKEFCRGLAETMVRLNPDAYVATMSKAQRSGKIFIDFFRNGRGATFIAPYSTRARAGAPIAVPLAWDELSPKLRADHFHLRNVMRRMARLSEDPWKDASAKKQVLSGKAIRATQQSSHG